MDLAWGEMLWNMCDGNISRRWADWIGSQEVDKVRRRIENQKKKKLETDTVQTTTILKSSRILWKFIRTLGDLLALSERQPIKIGWKNLHRMKIIMIIIINVFFFLLSITAVSFSAQVFKCKRYWNNRKSQNIYFN